ncbi:IS3 family transposase [Marinomonas ushuaiensis]|uniref:IS3 family transposase n=1 Tax=Marinomonas ushuaiensis TaxID=263818 RepID=UPI000A04AE12
MKKRIVKIFEGSFQPYGKRRLAFELKKESFNIGVFKTASLMKALGLVAKRSKKPHYYTAAKEQPTTRHF